MTIKDQLEEIHTLNTRWDT